MKAICNKREIIYRLENKSTKWLCDEINKRGIEISSGALYHLLNNRANWLLSYAMIISEILACDLKDIFLWENDKDM